jgi:two-component system nitrogen regulation response regulator GlnG
MSKNNNHDDQKISYFQSITELLQAGVNLIDRDGKIIYVNQAYCRMHNYTKEELVGKYLDMILPEHDPVDGLERYKKIINKEIDLPFIVEGINTRKDGSTFPVLISWNYLIINGELEGMVSVVQDLTQIKNVESALKESEKKVKKIDLEMKTLKDMLEKKEYLEYIMGDSDKIRQVHNSVEKVGKTDFTVIIYGETGTGKEIIANSIHNFSMRSNKPMISIDCGAIPESIIESELFGYVKGAFTGASETKDGAFQMANGGTIFLDEITNLSFDMQKKLLRVLQEKEVRKVGSTHTEKLDIRVIAASNENILNLVEKGNFRKDLFFRLNEFTISLPPLRERKDDIILLAQRFIKEISERLNITTKKISKGAIQMLLNYNWPGNVRELKNVIKKAIIISDDEIREEHLDLINDVNYEKYDNNIIEFNEIDKLEKFDLKDVTNKYTMRLEKEIIKKSLNRFGNNKSKVARFLNIDYKTLLTKIKDYKL